MEIPRTKATPKTVGNPSAPPSPIKSPAIAKSPPTSEPDPDQIALRAFQIWEQTGRQPGRELENWLRAEAELRRG